MPTERSLKAQIEQNAKRVFLNLNEFATTHDILYFCDGQREPPKELHIPAVIEENGDTLKTWNKQESYQISSDEQVTVQKTYTLFVALADFGEVPKRRRYLQAGDLMYQITAVTVEAGILKVKLRRLEE
ncbi:MAG: hypothetical protein LUE89_11360 [Clostridiales bacterium]|nr:hypothetical protein [Clostridiales bacterium]